MRNIQRSIGFAIALALVGCGDNNTTTSFTSITPSGSDTGDIGSTTNAASTGAPTTDGPTTSVSGTSTDGSATGTTADASATATTDATTTATTEPASTGEPPPACGNGVIDPLEECDDGNADNADACLDTCVAASCGDGFVGPGEMCDDGNDVDDDACSNACAPASCGDGKVQQGEDCDDGNADDTDACLATCKAASCGDMAVQAGVEECDDGNAVDTDACVAGCKAAKCGDSLVQMGVEQCDDGNMVDTDACLNTCKTATCGDGVIQMGVEQCDGGMFSNGACNACKLSCNAGFGDCNVMLADGCEINTQTDKNNCGMCGKVCAQTETCMAGVCKPNVKEFGPLHTFQGLQSNHYITQGCCSVNCAGNAAADAAYFCQRFYGMACTPKPGYQIGMTPFPTYPKMHKRNGCTQNGLDIPNTTCDGGPCKIGNWAENTTGLTNLVCVCP